MKNVKGVLICCPAGNMSMMAQTGQSLFTLAQYLTVRGIDSRLVWFSASDIVEVRNLFLTIWYDRYPGYSHMLFVDADMGFPPELIGDMLAFDEPLVGTVYSKRKGYPVKTVGTLFPGHSTKDLRKGFLPAQDLGCGVMLIKRRVVEVMLKKWPELSDTLPGILDEASKDFKLTRLIRAFDVMRDGNLRLSEDVSFCHRWRECGGEIWANVAHKISHVGPFDFAIKYGGLLEAYEKSENQTQAAA